MRRLAPWLPGTLLHMGKQSSRPHEITRLLLAQANTMLLRPVPIPPGLTTSDMFKRVEPVRPGPSRRPSRDGTRYGRDEGDSSILSLAVPEFSTEHGGFSERPQRLLYEALERLKEERGAAVLIVDALEEIGRGDGQLGFLPPTLPPGVAALLTVRPNTPAETWAKTKLHNVTSLTLDQLDREDIPLITRVSDESPQGSKFNDRVLAETSGVALVVRHIADEVRNRGGRFETVSIEGTRDLLFGTQADAWKNIRTKIFPEGLTDVLKLLALFEPIGAISRGMIQGYLESLKVDVSSSELDAAMQSVAVQLEGLKEDRLRLGVRAFAKHVRDKTFTDRDVQRAIRQVGRWMAEDDEAPSVPAGFFLRYWGGPDRDERTQRAAGDVFESYRKAGRWKALTTAATVLLKTAKRLVPIAEKALRAAAEAKYPPAMGQLGRMVVRRPVARQEFGERSSLAPACG